MEWLHDIDSNRRVAKLPERLCLARSLAAKRKIKTNNGMAGAKRLQDAIHK
ncbi:hypothetical protein D3C71_2025070 [compost metagenome]